MNYSSLSASDRRVLITGGIVAIVALLSFLDPNGNWGSIMALTLLAGLGAVFVGLQAQLAPSTKLPVSKGLLLLILGAVAAGATAISMLTYIGYITSNIADFFVLIMIVGLIASIVLLLTGWTAYKAETLAPAVPAAPGAPATPPPPPPPPPAAEA
jgi:phosphoglycerol transferase MdoB-like AlkP superfamily enzyme